ncbi:MAG: hypothetical protein R2939_22770 [Kofleriaceae bacterium]
MVDRDGKQRAVKILARTICRDLLEQGFDERQILALATELISNVTHGLASGREPQAAPLARPTV